MGLSVFTELSYYVSEGRLDLRFFRLMTILLSGFGNSRWSKNWAGIEFVMRSNVENEKMIIYPEKICFFNAIPVVWKH